MSSAATMSFASSYVLASRVRSKLTKQAADPRSSLRNLVLQANMLDNLMDHISTKTKTLKSESTVQFSVPEPIKHDARSTTERNNGPSVTEYEIDSDSDSDSDFDSDSDSEYDSDSFGSEDEKEVETAVYPVHKVSFAKKNAMPVIDLSDDSQLSVIIEAESEDDLPELTHSISSSESDSEDDIHEPHYVYSSAKYAQSNEKLDFIDRVMSTREHHQPHHHERHNAVYSMEAMF